METYIANSIANKKVIATKVLGVYDNNGTNCTEATLAMTVSHKTTKLSKNVNKYANFVNNVANCNITININ